MRTLVLGTAGHIDHGKSALVEALCGTHPDRLKEEQARGITIDLGFAHLTIDDLSVALVDVPGHERFVRTMVAGATGLDAVLLVVAADESVMPQTREHLDICRLLGVDRGVIVLTKCDLVDAETRTLAELDVRELVAGSRLAGVPVVATSTRTGEGLDALRRAIAGLAAVDAAMPTATVTRVPVDRAFSIKGFGTVVTGTLVGGALRVDDQVVLWPDGRPARVRGLQVHGQKVTDVTAPRRVAVNLGGVDLAHARRGQTLAPADVLPVTRRLDVTLETLPGSPPLRHGGRVRVHHGTTDVVARISLSAVQATEDGPWTDLEPGTIEAAVPPGGRAVARLRLAAPLVATRGDRFVCRLSSPVRTLGGGVVLDPDPGRGGVRRPGAASALRRLATSTPAEVAAAWLEDAGLTGLTPAACARRAGVSAAEADRWLRALVDASRAIDCGGIVVSRRAVETAATSLSARLRAHHQAQPDGVGVPREEARRRVAAKAPAPVFDAVLAVAGIASADRLSLPGHRPVVSAEGQAQQERVLTILRAAGLQPPDLATLAGQTGMTPDDLRRVLPGLGKDGRLVRLADLWFAAEVLGALRSEVRALGAGATFDVATAKARFGVSRKFAIPLLEFLDRERVTRRVGDKRVVL